ncbi:MAG: ribonuclease P protein component [Verrucomicrobia bacterium]|nr:MAG: ribonuclease P protein component [Verrucomicrobiota bacterium]
MPETRADMRFLPHQHLRRQRDFQVVRQKGRRINCGVFLFQILVRMEKDAGIPGPRLGVITSRRVGHAVFRNRLRRQMREIFRHHQRKLGSAVDLVLVMRSSAVGVPFGQLEARFLKAVDQVGLRGNTCL